ncbi:MAG: hypothetical protein FJX21_01585 [Alphaproteobacteria bacterium]|nr:hypothetical protein [Alphaproteobacteria bacterium]
MTAAKAKAPAKRKAQPERSFLEGIDVDRLAALVFELSSQLHVERHRRMALERALVGRGVVTEAEIAALAEDQAFLDAAREAADRSLRKLLRILAEDGDRRAPLRKEAL